MTEVIATKEVPRFSSVALSHDSRLVAVRHGRGVQLFEAATGQPVGFGDHAAVARILAEVKGTDYGLRSLVHAVVGSELFRNK